MSATETPPVRKPRKERDARYNRSDKGWERNYRYEKTARALRRKNEFDKRRGRNPSIQESRWAERDEYERSGSSLEFLDWLNETYPLPKLPRLTPEYQAEVNKRIEALLSD
jgi:hypothetical protein